MKNILKILLLLGITLGVFYSSSFDLLAATENLNTGRIQQENDSLRNNSYFNRISDNGFFKVGVEGERGLKNTFVRIAYNLKNFFFLVATIYFLSIVLRMLFSKTEEGVEKFKKGILWVSIGIIFMQISYMIVRSIYDEENIGAGLAYRVIDRVVYPLIDLAQTVAAFLFLGMAIYAFFRLVTAGGDEEKVKTGKMTIVYGIIGYLVIKISKALVFSIYGSIDCGRQEIAGGLFSITSNSCVRETDISRTSKIIVDIIDYANSFIGIVVVILIIYAGAQIIFGLGDEEKLKKAKLSILYIIIGIAILISSYLILTFFILPETTI